MHRMKLHWQILIAMLLAFAAGGLGGPDAGLLDIRFLDVYDFVGTLFLNALKMLIVPLIVASLITGVASMGSGEALGRLGIKTIIYYLSTTLLAVLLGLTLARLIEPGLTNGQPVGALLGLGANTAGLAGELQGKGTGDLADIFLRMIPANVVSVAAEGEMLGLIFFSLLFGYFTTRVPEPSRQGLLGFWQAVFDVMMRMTDWVLRFAPIGVFALVAKVAASTGLAAIQPLLWFFLTVMLGLALHMFVVLPMLLLLIGRVSPRRHFRAVLPALLTAFSTASSSATLPLTLECVEKNAGVSNRTSSFVLPLGATVNMDGTALYECVAVLFIAQAYGISLDWASQLTIVVLALATSIGVAGIPAASLVAIVIILGAVGLPAEGIGLILAVDRILDMARTSVNVFSDTTGAVIIGRLQGETGILEDQPAARSS